MAAVDDVFEDCCCAPLMDAKFLTTVNRNEYFPIEQLPETVMKNVLSYIDHNSALTLRSVSKRMKYFADLSFKTKKTLQATKPISSAQIKFFRTFYSNIKTLEVHCDNEHRFYNVALQFARMFASLEELRVTDSSNSSFINHRFQHIGLFSTIKSLRITNAISLSDDTMNILLPHLKHLQTLSIINAKITGTCFEQVPEMVTEIKWTTAKIWSSKRCLFKFGKRGENIESFTLEMHPTKATIDFYTIGYIRGEMPNLKTLRLKQISPEYKFNVKDLTKFNRLQYLEFECTELVGDLRFAAKMCTVNELCVNIMRTSDDQLAGFISNFPYIRKLELSFEDVDVSSFPFDVQLVEVLSSLKFLVSFSFKDRRKGSIDMKHAKLIPEAIRGMSSLKKVAFTFGRWTHRKFRFYKEFIDFANERPECNVFISMCLQNKLRRKQPSNLVVKFEQRDAALNGQSGLNVQWYRRRVLGHWYKVGNKWAH